MKNFFKDILLTSEEKEKRKEEKEKDLAVEIDAQRKIEEAYLINSPLVEGTYSQIEEMYDGNHWEASIAGVMTDRLENYSKLVHNFIADTVDRWASFIGGNPPTILVKNFSEVSITNDVTPQEQDVEADENEAEAVQKVIWNILRANSWRSLFLKLPYIQSKYGRVLIYVYLSKGQHYPVFEILRPKDNFPVFSSSNPKEILYTVGRKAEDLVTIKNKFGFEAVADDKDIEQGARPKAYVDRVITKNQMIVMCNSKKIGFSQHNYGKVPVFVAYNRVSPFSVAGKNDVEHLYKDQLAYNNTYSNINDAIEDNVVGKRLIKKPGLGTDMAKLIDRQQRHVTVGPETEITDLAPTLKIKEGIEFLNFISRNIEDQTGITELLKGRFSGSIATGVALSGLSRGIQDLALTKIVNLSETLEEAFNFAIFLLKKYRGKDPESGKSYKEIFKRDWYNLDFVWDNLSIQDERVKATTEVDLVNAKLKSRVTAMKDLKMNYPEDEQSRISWETLNPLINPELAMQLAAQKQQGQSFSPEEEEFQAKQENSKILKGMNVEVTETDPGQHAIHIENHEAIKNLARGKIKANLEAHIKKHKAGGNSKPAPASTGQASPEQPKGALPGMGNQQVRPMAQPGINNPQI